MGGDKGKWVDRKWEGGGGWKKPVMDAYVMVLSLKPKLCNCLLANLYIIKDFVT